jgi:hypothetical protein
VALVHRHDRNEQEVPSMPFLYLEAGKFFLYARTLPLGLVSGCSKQRCPSPLFATTFLCRFFIHPVSSYFVLSFMVNSDA